MKTAVIASLVVAAVVALSEAKVARLAGLRALDISECPHMQAMQNFDIETYLGRWYEMERTNEIFENIECVRFEYSAMGEGKVKMRAMGRTADGELEELTGIATPAGEPGVFVLEYAGYPPIVYTVLGTDYNTFAAVHHCGQIEGSRHLYSWILSRNTTLDDETHTQVYQNFENLGIDTNLFQTVHQVEDCAY